MSSAKKMRAQQDQSATIKKLHVFCQEGNIAMVKDILDRHLHLVNVPNDAGNPPLTIAIKCGHPQLVKYVLQFNPDVNLKNNVTIWQRLVVRANAAARGLQGPQQGGRLVASPEGGRCKHAGPGTSLPHRIWNREAGIH